MGKTCCTIHEQVTQESEKRQLQQELGSGRMLPEEVFSGQNVTLLEMHGDWTPRHFGFSLLQGSKRCLFQPLTKTGNMMYKTQQRMMKPTPLLPQQLTSGFYNLN